MEQVRIRVVRSSGEASPTSLPSVSDLALLATLLAVHLVPVVAAAIGAAWGSGIVGYATAVVVLTGRQLVHDVALRLWAGPSAAR